MFPMSAAALLCSYLVPTTRTVRHSPVVASEAPHAEELIAAARHYINEGTGYYSPLDASLMAEDYVFRGPSIGPLNKRDYISVMQYFMMHEAFEDFSPNAFGFTVDPMDPLRVWFFVRASGTYTAKLGGAAGDLAALVTPPASRTRYQGMPEAWSLLFDAEKRVRGQTAGYVADRFEAGSTAAGRGLSFRVLATLGLELPFQPGDVRLQAIQRASKLLEPTGLVPVAVSRAEEVPAWWTSTVSTVQGAD